MTNKFFSKEIHFLKTESDDFTIQAPETYLSDLLLKKTDKIKKFENKLSRTKIADKKFVCAVIQISSDSSEFVEKNTKDLFEKTFNLVFDNISGIWESLTQTLFVITFWDFGKDKKASELVLLLKKKISRNLDADTCIGAANYPFKNFSKPHTFANAIKALDHAAFFGKNAYINFDATSLNICGDRLFQLSKSDKAIVEYKKGIEIEPDNINLINSLGVCYAVMGDLDKAQLEFDKALELNPEELMVIYNIARIYQIKKDTDKAITLLRKAHDIDPDVFEVELLLGQLLFQKSDNDRAMSHLEKAGTINSKSGLACRIKGQIHLMNSLFEKAGQEFNQAVKLNPSDAVSLSGYAKTMELQEKNLKIALTFAKNSVALEPDNSLFKERLRTLQEKIEEIEALEKNLNYNEQAL